MTSYLNNTSSNITEFHTFTKGLILFKSSCEMYHLWYTKDHFSMFSPDEMVTPTPTLVDYSWLRFECSPFAAQCDNESILPKYMGFCTPSTEGGDRAGRDGPKGQSPAGPSRRPSGTPNRLTMEGILEILPSEIPFLAIIPFIAEMHTFLLLFHVRLSSLIGKGIHT